MTSSGVIERLCKEFPRHKEGVANCIAMLEEGMPAPFIARYRKQQVLGMTEGEIRTVANRLRELEELERRRRSMLRILETVPGVLTPERKEAIERCPDLQTLEDIYAPIRPKKNDDVNQAIQKGLEPLADFIQRKDLLGKTLSERANEYVDAARGIEAPQAALDGAKRILVERLFDDPEWRRLLRLEMREKGSLVADPIEGKSRNAEKYKNYTSHRESLHSIPSHRMLALRRAEREKALKLHIEIDDAAFIKRIEDKVLESIATDSAGEELKKFLQEVIQDAYRHLRERCGADVRLEVKERADEQAIQVAARNIRHLLMASPLGARPVLGIDVGARNASMVVVDANGKAEAPISLPILSDEEKTAFATQLQTLLQEKEIAAVAIGGSSLARAVLSKVREILRAQPKNIDVVYWADSVAESYADSAFAKQEFSGLDAAARSALFMGRRLQDPLIELVKLEPKSLGIGQYQHDVGRFRLTQALLETVQSCVCRVGVDPNQASEALLKYIPGFNETIAKAVVEDRMKNGAFATRQDLKRVPGIDEKVFNLAAGFLKIESATSPLDSTRVHPDQYPIAEKIAATLSLPLAELIGNRKALSALDRASLVSESLKPEALHEVLDLLAEGKRDLRGRFRSVAFRKDIQSVADLQEGMTLEGIVSNVTNFGAFVDIGLEHDGLVHISELADRFIRLPHEIVRLGEIVTVRVLSLDKEKGRLSLSMKPSKEAKAAAAAPARQSRAPREQPKPLFVRAATSRRDGLMEAKEDKGKKRGKGPGQGGDRKDRKPGRGGGGRGGAREEMKDLAKLDARVERKADRQDRNSRRGQTAEGAENGAPEETVNAGREKEKAKPEKKAFSNNPFQSFFQSKESPEKTKSSEAAPRANS